MVVRCIFLQQKKRYRNIYKWVLEKREIGDKSLQTHLDPNEFENQSEIEKVSCIFKVYAFKNNISFLRNTSNFNYCSRMSCIHKIVFSVLVSE